MVRLQRRLRAGHGRRRRGRSSELGDRGLRGAVPLARDRLDPSRPAGPRGPLRWRHRGLGDRDAGGGLHSALGSACVGRGGHAVLLRLLRAPEGLRLRRCLGCLGRARHGRLRGLHPLGGDRGRLRLRRGGGRPGLLRQRRHDHTLGGAVRQADRGHGLLRGVLLRGDLRAPPLDQPCHSHQAADRRCLGSARARRDGLQPHADEGLHSGGEPGDEGPVRRGERLSIRP
mmetsp:Transcript_83741/g.234633  ORF Transcript_83741/g.234633 Transcript_83741/m.234633 type:complete len:229 (-) Transcript_83741:557-1243(-)